VEEIGFEREDKEFLNRINIIPIPDEVVNEYIRQTLQKGNNSEGNSSNN